MLKSSPFIKSNEFKNNGLKESSTNIETKKLMKPLIKIILLLCAICTGASCEYKITKDVPPLLDDKESDSTEWSYLEGEVLPQKTLPCFQGAYYRKAVSSTDYWIGIEGTVVLPQIQFDEDRKNPNKAKQYLDNPSIYIGGKMDGQETDIGLTWEVIRDENNNVSEERLAFRPFLRRTSHKSGQASLYTNAPAEKEFYWYPGDEVEMRIEVIEEGVLKFEIHGQGKSYETTFEAAGYGFDVKGEFKRVNAIDQVANEGKPAQATATVVSNSKWHGVNLIRQEKGETLTVPMHNGRFTSMLCPEEKFFKTEQNASDQQDGSEAITISGKGF